MPAYFGELKYMNAKHEHKLRLEKKRLYKRQLLQNYPLHYKQFLVKKIKRMEKQFHL